MAKAPRTRRAGGGTKSTQRKGAPTRRPKTAAATAPRPARKTPPVSPEDEAAFTETVIATGEAKRVTRGGTLPPGATHEIVEDETGTVKVVRRRFSIT